MIFLRLMADRYFPVLNITKKWKHPLDTLGSSFVEENEFFSNVSVLRKEFFLLISLV